jgi:cytochrome c biogenesis protein CcmG, thiol:disulfide interchange protein DsbE
MTGSETTRRGSHSEMTKRERPVPLIVALPLVLLVPFLGLLFLKLYANMRSSDPSQLPSALIGKPAPEFDLPPIPRTLSDYGPVPGLSSGALRTGQVSLLNVWASWCTPCVAEHPQLIELGKQGIPLYSINYKDKPEAARRFLAQYGNPFRAIGADQSGLTAIDFGVYGVPETFVIDGRGRIAYRFPGPLTPEIVAAKIMPAVRKAEREGAPPRS